MHFTSILTFLLGCAATQALFRGPPNPNLLPRQVSTTISGPAFPTLTAPSGTAFPTGTGTGTGIPHSSHGTRPQPRPSASHHSAGVPHHSTRAPNEARQYPSITASSFGTISTAGPVNGTRTRTSFGRPTGGHSTTRRPRPTGTGTSTVRFAA